jgi:outer membrane biosynthesis protein TonB
MKPQRKIPALGTVSVLIVLGVLVGFDGPWAVAQEPPQKTNAAPEKKSAPPLDDHQLSSALCSIVYQVDRDPGPRGYHYLFYGNGFFINSDGYLITAAHVLSQLHGGQPYLLLRVRSTAPRFVAAQVVAIDSDHDVAILRATPNPFAGNFSVSFLNIDHAEPATGERVLAAALRPFKPRDSYTLEPALEERSAGEVLNFQFSKLDQSGAVDTEIFLFAHKILPGQSGAPVLSLDSHEVVGFVEGQWLRAKVNGLAPAPKEPALGPPLPPAAAANITAAPGAVIPMHYAIALLQANHVRWHTADEPAPDNTGPAATGGKNETNEASPPVPYSLVPAPYPPQSLAGGEVLLDALVARTGTISDIRVVSGQEPFLAAALGAVHSWTFIPAHSAGQAVEARVAIIFQFPNPYIPPRTATTHHYQDASAEESSSAPKTPGPRNDEARAARATETASPQYPAGANSAGGSVILRQSIDAAGHVTAVEAELDAKPLTAAVAAAAGLWIFAPAQKSGAAIDSTAIIAVTFREPLVVSAPTR